MDTQRGKLALKQMVDTSVADLQTWSPEKLNTIAVAYGVSPDPKTVAKTIMEPIWIEVITKEAHMFPTGEDIHAIWIGSYISDKHLENIKSWFSLLHPNTVTLWYDSKHPLGTQGDEPLGDRLAGELAVKDIRSIDIFNPDKYKDKRIKKILPKLEKIYNIESGITPRKIDKVKTTEFINFGLTTDILRLLLLYRYPGLYLDVDITRNPNVKDKPVPCKIGLCFAWHPKGAGPADPEGVDNSVIYYNKKGSELLVKYLEKVVDRYYAKDGINKLQCQYLLIPDQWVRLTGNTSGPGAAPDELKFNWEELDVLYNALQDPEPYVRKKIEEIYEGLIPSKEDVRRLNEAEFYDILEEDEPDEDEYGDEDETDDVSEILRLLDIIKNKDYEKLLKDIRKEIEKEEAKFIVPKHVFRTRSNEESTWQTSKAKRAKLFEQLKAADWKGCNLEDSTIRYIQGLLK